MLTKKVITLRFDNVKEYKQVKQNYIEMGYTIIGYGSDDEWYFTGEKYYTSKI